MRYSEPASLLLLSLALPLGCRTPGNHVALDGDAHRSLDRLAAEGFLETHLGARPVTTAELDALGAEAPALLDERRADGVATSSAAATLLADLETFTAREPTGDGWYYLQPLGRPRLDFLYAGGPPSTISGTSARQHSLVFNNEGIEPEAGFNTFVRLSAQAGLGPLSALVTPLFSYAKATGDTTAALQHAYAKLALGPLDVSFGKQPLWWGPGRYGSLLLSTNAAPLTMLRVATEAPVLLPWIFSYLGPFRMDVFIARLEEDGEVAHPHLFGTRIDFKPHPSFQIGGSRTVLFGGRGLADLSASAFWDAFTGPLAGETDISSSLAAFDARLALFSTELYTEIGFASRAGSELEASYLAGLRAYVLDPVELTIEYARIGQDAWYRPSRYPSGTTYRGRLLGHHAGPGSSLFAEAGLRALPRTYATAYFAYQDREGAEALPSERHVQLGTRWTYRLGTALFDWHGELDASLAGVSTEMGPAEPLRGLLRTSIRGYW